MNSKLNEEEHVEKIQKKIHKLTLECLTNHVPNKQNNNVIVNKKEYKFYRKRIVDLTKQMLLSSETRNIMTNDLRNTFNLYTNLCIEYFKVIDTTDFFQEEYETLIDNVNKNINENINESVENNKNNLEKENNNELQELSLSEINSLLMNTNTKFEIEDDTPITYHQTKNVNLFDKSLKNKRICKKKKYMYSL